MLNKTQRSISALIREGKTADEIVAAGKKSKGEGMSRANVYKVIKILKAEGVIKDEVS
jgi:Fe2+ or Zn2+ uptake regulation protein